MTTKKQLFVAVPLASAIAFGALGPMGAASSSGPSTAAGGTTTVFIAHGNEGVGHGTDVKPRGESAGDQFQSSVPLYQDGERVGRGDLVGIGLPRLGNSKFRGMLFGSMNLPDGEITVQSSLIDIENNTYAVTGGTGAYAGATGIVVFEALRRGRVSVTVTLQ